MKHTFWAMVIAGIGGLFLFYLYLQVSMTHAARINQTALSESLSNAMVAGAMEASFDFSEDGAKENYIDSATSFLAGTFGAESESANEGMMQKMPVMFFLSDDGFYANYIESYTAKEEGVTFEKYTRVTTEKMPYVYESGNYNVSFTLSGMVDVAKTNSDEHVEGEFKDVYTELGAPSDLYFMSSKSEYDSEIKMIIAAEIKELSEYYIENKLFGNKKALYTINIPQGDSGIARAVSDNTVLTLYQGKNENAKEGEINIYSLAAVELSPDKRYTAGMVQEGDSVVLYYHADNCEDVYEKYFRGTMDECARLGALPCPDCLLK